MEKIACSKFQETNLVEVAAHHVQQEKLNEFLNITESDCSRLIKSVIVGFLVKSDFVPSFTTSPFPKL